MEEELAVEERTTATVVGPPPPAHGLNVPVKIEDEDPVTALFHSAQLRGLEEQFHQPAAAPEGAAAAGENAAAAEINLLAVAVLPTCIAELAGQRTLSSTLLYKMLAGGGVDMFGRAVLLGDYNNSATISQLPDYAARLPNAIRFRKEYQQTLLFIEAHGDEEGIIGSHDADLQDEEGNIVAGEISRLPNGEQDVGHVLDVVNSIVKALPADTQRALRVVYVSACSAMKNVTKEMKNQLVGGVAKYPLLQSVTLVGDKESLEFSCSRAVFVSFIEQVSRLVQEMPPQKWRQEGLTEALVSAAVEQTKVGCGRLVRGHDKRGTAFAGSSLVLC